MKKWYILIAITLITLFSCEEDVVLDLRTIEKKLVIEAKVTDDFPVVSVALSYSQNFYDSLSYVLLSNAVVSVVNESGETEILKQDMSGQFISIMSNPRYGEKYTLKINYDGREIEASTLLPQPMEIAGVTFIPNPFLQTNDSLNVFVSVMDRVGEDNYFRLKVNKLGEKKSGEYYLSDDSFGKDGLITLPIYYKNFTAGDTIVVELYHLNELTYTYYSELSENINGSFNSIAPGNPVSNMPYDEYGYFGGYTVDRDTVIVGVSLF